MKNLIFWPSIALLILLTSCGGGGGDVTFGPGSGSGEGTTSGNTSGSSWRISAVVSQDGCGERISAVEQNFTIDGDTVNTGIVTISGTRNGGVFSAGFSESNGDCQRSYQIEITDLNSSSSDVSLSTQSNCSGVVCENKWIGTAQRQ